MDKMRRRGTARRDLGFTLIELLIVIIIIGILAAIAIPVFLSQRQKGYEAQAKADLRNVAMAEETYLTGNPSGYAACDTTTGSTGCVSVLSSLVWRASSNAVTAVGVSGAAGFCAVSKASPPDTYFVYDSQAGGLQGAKATSFATISWPAGACASSAARPAAF